MTWISARRVHLPRDDNRLRAGGHSAEKSPGQKKQVWPARKKETTNRSAHHPAPSATDIPLLDQSRDSRAQTDRGPDQQPARSIAAPNKGFADDCFLSRTTDRSPDRWYHNNALRRRPIAGVVRAVAIGASRRWGRPGSILDQDVVAGPSIEDV